MSSTNELREADVGNRYIWNGNGYEVYELRSLSHPQFGPSHVEVVYVSSMGTVGRNDYAHQRTHFHKDFRLLSTKADREFDLIKHHLAVCVSEGMEMDLKELLINLEI